MPRNNRSNSRPRPGADRDATLERLDCSPTPTSLRRRQATAAAPSAETAVTPPADPVSPPPDGLDAAIAATAGRLARKDQRPLAVTDFVGWLIARHRGDIDREQIPATIAHAVALGYLQATTDEPATYVAGPTRPPADRNHGRRPPTGLEQAA